MGPQPPVIGIGAQKSGTTSVAHFLKKNGLQVPVKAAWGKELNWFEESKRPFESAVHEYRELFAGLDHPGEFTPTYLFSPQSLWGIYKAFPEARLMIFLRDPVQRFFSAIEHGRAVGKVPLHLSADSLVERAFALGEKTGWEPDLLGRGLYEVPLKMVFKLFRRRQIYVEFLENWINPSRVETVCKSVLQFSNLDPSLASTVQPQRVNSRAYHLKRANLTALEPSEAAVERLTHYYSQFRPALEKLIGTVPW